MAAVKPRVVMRLDSAIERGYATVRDRVRRMVEPWSLPPRFPSPRFDVAFEPDQLIPMRDGVRLATDLYVPQGISAELPAILIRTQYDKEKFSPAANACEDRQVDAGVPAALASQGFVVAVQDLRGLFRSEGRYSLARHDGPDGFDTVQWLSRQPWCNGAVGTFGGSSLGITQLLLARHRHPNHRCAIAQASGGALGSADERHRHWEAWEGGTVKIGWLLAWFDRNGITDRSARLQRTAEELRAALWSLPVADMADRLGSPPTDWRDWVTRPPDDPAWGQFDFLTEEVVIDLPTLFVNTWHDTCPGDTIREFELFRRRAALPLVRDSQFLILGPGTHCQGEYLDEHGRVGELGYPSAAEFDYWGAYLAWFEHWLGDRPAVSPPSMPRAQYYLMGRNRWQSAVEWPIPGTHANRWHLRGVEPANTRLGGGRLSLLQPEGQEPADCFIYDPGDPVPGVGGAYGSLPAVDEVYLNGPADQASVELREDVLCYTSEALETKVTVVGLVKSVLFISSDAPDTDFTAKLVDVWPDGRVFDLCRGIMRARYREGFERQMLLQRDEIVRIEIDMQATAHTWLTGHRIRLEISSSEFPTCDRNLNTGQSNELTSEWRIARNVVHHSSTHASYLELPAIDE